MSALPNRSASISSCDSELEDRADSDVARKQKQIDRELIKLANKKKKLYTILKQSGINIIKNGSNDWSVSQICPFPHHKGGNERTGSFAYNFKKDIFNCFGCGASGGVVEFISLKTRASKLEIARSILDECGDEDISEDEQEDLSSQCEIFAIEFSQYLQNLIQKNKSNRESLRQIERIIEWFDNFLLLAVPKNKITPAEFLSTIEKLKNKIKHHG